MQIPDNLRYTSDHEWVRIVDGLARVGITDYAQDALGDVVFVDLPAVGDATTSTEQFGEVESTKSVSDLYAPVSGRVTEVNAELANSPGLVNSDPYGEGWLCAIEITSHDELDALLSPGAYAELTGG